MTGPRLVGINHVALAAGWLLLHDLMGRQDYQCALSAPRFAAGQLGSLSG